MPEVKQRITVPAACAEVWRFVRDINNWAPEVPGYQEHTILDENRSRWVVRGDLKVLSRIVEAEVTVTAWSEPDEVLFNVHGINEQVEGSGRFGTVEKSPNETELELFLQLQAAGKIGPMVNALLKPVMPVLAGAFAKNLAKRLSTLAAT